MTNVKRMLLLSTALLLVLTLGACSGVGRPKADVTPIPTAEPAQQPLDNLEDLGTFVSIVPDKNGQYNVPQENEIVKQHIIQSIARDKQVKLDMNVMALPQDDYINQINNVLLSGQAVDSISGDYDLFKVLLGTEGLCAPMDSLLQNHAPNVLSLIDEARWNAVMHNNQIYAIPGCSLPEETVMLARGDILTMIGLPSIVTKEDFLASLGAFKAIDKLPLAMTWSQIMDCLAYSYAIPSSDYAKKRDKIYMREHVKYYLNDFIVDMRKFYSLGYLHPDVFTISEDEMRELFITGQAGIYAAEYNDIVYDMDALSQQDPAAEMSLITAPTNRRMVEPKLSAELPIDSVLMLYGDGKHHQALLTYKDWAYSDRVNYVTTQHGVTGTHINYNNAASEFEYLGPYAEGTPVYTGLYTLDIDLNGIFPPALLKSSDPALQRKSDLVRQTYDYLTTSEVVYEYEVPLSDEAQAMMGVYRSTMDDAVRKYVTGEINKLKFDELFNSCNDEAKVIIDDVTPKLEEILNAAPQQ